MTLPVVWVPGHLCGAWLYADQIEAFAAHEAVVADVTRDDQLAAMAGRLLGTAPDRFVIAGLSMGGMVAMEAMAAAPDRIVGAVLMDTDPYAAREKEISFRRDQMAAARRHGLEAVARPFIERFFGHDRAAGERHAEAILARMRDVPLDVYDRQAEALNHRRDMLDRLQGFAGPVAVVVGVEDAICPPKLHHPLARALPDAVLTEIPDTGHLSTIEAPEAVNRTIAGLLERVR